MATANGPATAQDVVDVEIPGLDAQARVLLLKGCPPVLSLGRLIEEHSCRFEWSAQRVRPWSITLAKGMSAWSRTTCRS